MRYLKIVSTLLFLCGCLSSSCSFYEQPTSPLDRVHFPISVAVHPSGKYLYVVNSNFDNRYRQYDGGSLTVIEAKSGKVLPKNSIHIPSFGGLVTLNPTASVAYVPTRYLSTVTALKISPSGDKVFCVDQQGNESSDPKECEISQLPEKKVGDRTLRGAKIGTSPYSVAVDTKFRKATVSGISGSTTLTLSFPGGENRVFTGDLTSLQSQISAVAGVSAAVVGGDLEVMIDTSMASHPAALALIPSGNQSVKYDADDVVYVSSMQANTIATLLFPGQSQKNIEILNTPVKVSTGGVALRPHSNDVVVVDRGGPNLVVMQPHYLPPNSIGFSAIDALFARLEFPLTSNSSEIYGRGVVFNPSGREGYVITQNPNALYFIRVIKELVTSPYAGLEGRDVYRVTRTLPLKRNPTSITYFDSSLGGRLLYITCTEAKSILVVDATVGAVVDEIFLGDTPSDFVVNEAACRENMDNCVGYVALYDDTPNGDDTCSTAAAGQCGSIGVVDLNPLSPSYHQLVRKFE